MAHHFSTSLAEMPGFLGFGGEFLPKPACAENPQRGMFAKVVEWVFRSS